jgi:hypothetical protein
VAGHDFRSRRETAELRQCGENRLARQAHGDAEPAHEYGTEVVESTLDEPFPERIGFEAGRAEGGRRPRLGDAGAGAAVPVSPPGRRVVDLEHGESSGRVPIGERIERGVENRILVYTGIAAGEPLSGEPAPAHRSGTGTGEQGRVP